jgi:ribonuclease HI
MNIEVYSDGSATTVDKPGGWAWVLSIDGEKFSEGSGYSPNATNNDMELEAAIQGLSAVLKWKNDYGGRTTTLEQLANLQVKLCSDSQLTLGWASGEYRFNQLDKLDKYKQLRTLMEQLNASCRWIKGHSGDPFNDRCDRLANNARKGIVEVLDKPVQKVDTRIGIKKKGTLCLYFGDQLKVIDLEQNIIENYNREAHGKRGSAFQIREEKDR